MIYSTTHLKDLKLVHEDALCLSDDPIPVEQGRATFVSPHLLLGNWQNKV